MRERNSEVWAVPYLPIDPSDIGREYEPIVRINSQSGKGGVAFVMDTYFGFKLPKGMHKEFANVIQEISEKQGEVAPKEVMDAFRRTYLDMKEPIHFRKVLLEFVFLRSVGKIHLNDTANKGSDPRDHLARIINLRQEAVGVLVKLFNGAHTLLTV